MGRGNLIGRRLPPALIIAALLATAALVPAAEAKKKGDGGGTVDITKPVALPIPDGAPGLAGVYGLLTSTIEVGKQFKGKRIRDVDVTVQTAGLTGTTPAGQLRAKLTAPNGATIILFNQLTAPVPPNLSIGPLTLDDESRFRLGTGTPVDQTRLYQPWAGTARPAGVPLAVMDDGPATGTWTLRVLDFFNSQTSSLSSWRLKVTTGKPYLTK